MAPELKEIFMTGDRGNFNPELCDIFSLGLSILRFVNSWDEKNIENFQNIW